MLSTPPAFILSQDQTLMLKFQSGQNNTRLFIPFTVLGCWIFFNVRLSFSKDSENLIWIFKDLWLFSFQCSMPFLKKRLSYFTTALFPCQELFSFSSFRLFCCVPSFFATAFIFYQNLFRLSRTFLFFFLPPFCDNLCILSHLPFPVNDFFHLFSSSCVLWLIKAGLHPAFWHLCDVLPERQLC